jgi:hypothetical protein
VGVKVVAAPLTATDPVHGYGVHPSMAGILKASHSEESTQALEPVACSVPCEPCPKLQRLGPEMESPEAAQRRAARPSATD